MTRALSLGTGGSLGRLSRTLGALLALVLVMLPTAALASEIPPLPDLSKVTFFGGMSGNTLLLIGLVV